MTKQISSFLAVELSWGLTYFEQFSITGMQFSCDCSKTLIMGTRSIFCGKISKTSNWNYSYEIFKTGLYVVRLLGNLELQCFLLCLQLFSD